MIFRATDNVFVQGGGRPGHTPLPWSEPGATNTLDPGPYVHLVPFFDTDAEGIAIERLTAASIRAANTASGGGNRLAAATLWTELGAVPEGFHVPHPLQRTVLDLHSFEVARPLPLLFDVLDVGSQAADGTDYLVFSNADICLQPHFYATVGTLLRSGFDCLIINRRTVGAIHDYRGHPEVAALEIGRTHPGADCFVFPSPWIGEFVRSEACIGMGYVIRSLLYNLIARAESLLILEEACLTYHYGDDMPWSDARYRDYLDHNRRQAVAVFLQLLEKPVAAKRLRQFCRVYDHSDLRIPSAPVSRWRRLWRG